MFAKHAIAADCCAPAGVKPETIVCLTQFGKAISKPYKRAARPQDNEFAKKWFSHAQQLFAEGLLQPYPHHCMGGLSEIATGWEW
jgi:hypothetical protein